MGWRHQLKTKWLKRLSVEVRVLDLQQTNSECVCECVCVCVCVCVGKSKCVSVGDTEQLTS